MESKKLVTFLDTVGRTIIGELAKEDDTFLYVKNPAVVNVVPQQDPTNPNSVRMALQLFPLFFREFLAAPDEGTVWKYRRANIVEVDGDVTFAFQLNIQYQQIMNQVAAKQTQPAPAQAANNDKPVIKLFDD